jgi:uncharacterized membrane protein YeaQ/YmgE (transglycosylase-associated protein family)
MSNLFVYLVIGGILGWIASLIMQTDAQQGVLLNIIVGIVGAFVAGLAVNGGSIGSGYTLKALASSLVGAVLLLGIANLVRRGKLR